MKVNYELIKEKILKDVNANLQECISLNDYLADNPEVSGEEAESSKRIVELLKEKGFTVEYPFAGFDYAFKASHGSNNHEYRVAILTEYDALPELGHACGHCVSGSISVLASLALINVQDELDIDIHVIGTPQEETEGAKTIMSRNGIFDEYDMAMMVHLYDQNLIYCNLLGLLSRQFEFRGKAAHASAAPWEGVNALNAAQLMFHGVDMMRQHVTPDVRIHGIYKKSGVAANIVPEFASVHFYIRALDNDYLENVLQRVNDCALGAAIATQTTWETYPTETDYKSLKRNPAGESVIKEVYEELEIQINGDHSLLFGSSDIGDVSFKCPAFHPALQLVEKGVAIHTREFAASVKSQRAHDCIREGASVIGLTIAKIFSDETMIAAMKTDFLKKQREIC